MTEAEWLACSDPHPMLSFIGGRVSDRKLRLFACACARRMHWLCWHKQKTSWVVRAAERFADGLLSRDEWEAIPAQLGSMGGISSQWAVNCGEHAVIQPQARTAADRALNAGNWFYYLSAVEREYLHRGIYEFKEPVPEGVAAREQGWREQADLMRDVVGNPFAPMTVSTSLFSAADLARTIYTERAFQRMPELADALEKAGCTEKQVLDHCRAPVPHVRGCWVIDALLGKA